MINSKQTSKTNNNMASKFFLVINSIGFHVNKLVPKSDTSESKTRFNFHFHMRTKIYPHKQLSVQQQLLKTISSTYNMNKSSNTVNDNSSILIPSSTTTTATNNRTNNKNTNNNAVNDSNKLLTPTSAPTTTPHDNANSVNGNNSENNTNSKLIPSSIDKEINEFEKCENAAKQDVK